MSSQTGKNLIEELIAQNKLSKQDLVDYLQQDSANQSEVKPILSNKPQNKFFSSNELRVQGTKMLNLIGEIYDNLDQIPVYPNIKLYDLKSQISEEPPQEGSTFDEILEETKNKFVPAITHWQHPKFFAYFPSSISHPTILADMFASTFHSPAFTWNASPAHTELEYVVVDWIAKMLDLPPQYQLKNSGGGAISVSTSDSYHLAAHAAKLKKINQMKLDPLSPEILKFSSYVFEHTFNTVEKALRIKDINYIRNIPVYFDDQKKNFLPDMVKLEAQIEEDVKNGLHPFFISATYGTTPTCANDPFDQIITLSKKYEMWLNLDCAYAGTTWVCPEYRSLRPQNLLNEVDSLQINFAKLGMVGNVGTLTYVQDKKTFTSAFKKDQGFEITKNAYSGSGDAVDAKDWMIGFGRRWNALKFYYNLKAFGVKGYQEHIRSKAQLAKRFQQYIEKSDRFELFSENLYTLVTFKLKTFKQNQNQNDINKKLKELLDKNTLEGYVTPSNIAGIYFFRFVICNPNTTEQHVDEFWQYLNKCTDQLIRESQ
ncbi:hypothetical protein ABPG72_019085 [Tetrahymena utriculariae]